MPSIDFVVESPLTRTPRVKQLEAMFDVPAKEALRHEWAGNVPLEERDWNVGLIVGPSGSGKSSVGRQLFGDRKPFEWQAGSVVDDFDKGRTIQAITDVCSAVGFNTIPSWMKPYGVLSNGERFRAELARHLLESADPIVVDEFTSVVDRQVGKIASHAVQKYVRKHSRKFVAISCHYDIAEWLQPDWVLEPATMDFHWRSVQRRPELSVEVGRVATSSWRLFAPFHYLTADLHRSANCFVLFVDGVPAAFAGVLHRPHASAHDIKGVSRLVTLPDYQGLGLAFVLVDLLGSAYRSLGWRLRTYPAHPALIRGFDRSGKWSMKKKPGTFSPTAGRTGITGEGRFGGRPCAVFEYAGERMGDFEAASKLTGESL